jgi:hypothetical protein
MTSQSSRTIIRQWWKQAIDGQEAVDPKVFARKCADELVTDPAFCATFLAEFVYETAYNMGQLIVSANRSMLRCGDTYKTRDALKREIAEEAEQSHEWSKWMENDKDTGVLVSFKAMTKEQVFTAALTREDRGYQELRDAAFFRAVAGKMQAGQIVGDVWSDAELDYLRKNIDVKATISLKPNTKPTRKAA